MGLAVFLANLACLLVTGLAIIRKQVSLFPCGEHHFILFCSWRLLRYGDGMRQSYVQTESFENNIFQFIFARWDYRTDRISVARRHEDRFTTEIKNVLLERKAKQALKFDRSSEKILFQMKRLLTWLLTLVMFAGAVAALYFVHRFSFQVRLSEPRILGRFGRCFRFRKEPRKRVIVEQLESIVRNRWP